MPTVAAEMLSSSHRTFSECCVCWSVTGKATVAEFARRGYKQQSFYSFSSKITGRGRGGVRAGIFRVDLMGTGSSPTFLFIMSWLAACSGTFFQAPLHILLITWFSASRTGEKNKIKTSAPCYCLFECKCECQKHTPSAKNNYPVQISSLLFWMISSFSENSFSALCRVRRGVMQVFTNGACMDRHQVQSTHASLKLSFKAALWTLFSSAW